MGFFDDLIDSWKEQNDVRPSLFNLDRIPLELVGKYQMPKIKDTPIQVQELIPFNFCQSTGAKENLETVCFFITDSLFERVWNNPVRYINVLKKFNGVLTPDFSLYDNMPLSLQLYNCYRSKWCGAFWQHHGISVIPTATWLADERSFDFCFDGLEGCSQIAVSTMGCVKDLKNGKFNEGFERGFKKMTEVLKPKEVMWYGNIAEICYEWHNNIRVFEPFFRKFEMRR